MKVTFLTLKKWIRGVGHSRLLVWNLRLLLWVLAVSSWSVGFSYGQAMADPPLADGINACNGDMAVEFTPPTPGSYFYLHFKVIHWGNATNEALGKYSVYKFNPQTNKFERPPEGDGGRKLEDWLNGIPLGAPTPQQHPANNLWWEFSGTLSNLYFNFQNGTRYLIRNRGGVFHFGWKADHVSVPPTAYHWITNTANFNTDIEIKRNGVLLPKNLAGAYEVSICKADDISLGAGVKLQNGATHQDYFRYSWEGLRGIQAPQDSSHVEAHELVADPVRVRVKRLGMCGIEKSVDLVIHTLSRPTPSLDLSSSAVCVQQLNLPENLTVTPQVWGQADAVEWSFLEDGGFEGNWLPLGQETLVPPTTNFSPKVILVGYSSLQLPPNNVTEGLPVTHKVRLVAKNRECAGEVIQSVEVYPPIPSPTLVLDHGANASHCSPLAVTVRNTTKPAKSGVETWVIAKPGAALGVPTLSDHGVAATDVLLTSARDKLYHTFSFIGAAAQSYTVRYLIQDKSGVCLRHADLPITVNPLIIAKFDIEVQGAVPNGLPCSPVNVTARDKSEGVPARWDWKLKHNGVLHQFGALPATNVATESNFSATDSNPLEIQLTVENAQGCASVRTLPLQVYPKPEAVLTATQESTDCLPVRYKLTATNVSQTSEYRWWESLNGQLRPLGDPSELQGGVSTVESQFEFDNDNPQVSNREVILELRSRAGCVTRIPTPIVVPPKLEAQLVVVDALNAGCPEPNGVRLVRVRDESIHPALGPAVVREWFLDNNPIAAPDIVQLTAKEWQLALHNMSTTLEVRNKLRLAYTIGRGTPQECVSFSEVELLTYPRIALDFNGFYDASQDPPQPWTPGAATPVCALVDAKFEALPHSGAEGQLVWRVFTGTDTVKGALGGAVEVDLDNMTAAPITYTVRLKGRRGECASKVDKEYVVNPRAIARMELTTLDVCTPYRIKVVNTTQADPNAQYIPQWHMDGGVETPPGSGEYVYSTPGVKRVKLSTTYGNCVSETEESVFTVLDPVVVNVGLQSPSDKVCAPARVDFSNASSGVTRMLWYFERFDPTSGVSSDVPPTDISGLSVTFGQAHAYENKSSKPLAYHVLVRGENERGCAQEATIPVTIYPEPIAVNSYDVANQCTPFKLRFESTSPSLSDYIWTFTPVGTAMAFGTHQVKQGVQPAPVEVVLPNTSPHDSLSYRIEYEGWKQWPDGGPRCAVPRKWLGMVRVPPQLNPVITPSEEFICSGESITFRDQSTGGNIKQIWDYGDGAVEEGPKQVPMVHIFENSSSRNELYTVRVTSIQVAFGCTQTVEIPITVHPEVKAIFAHETPAGRECDYPLPVEFHNHSMVNEEVSEVQQSEYIWEYGYTENGVAVDYTTATKDSHIHLFKMPSGHNESQTRTVKLIATQRYASGKECANVTTADVVVWPELQPSFSMDVDRGCLPLPVRFHIDAKPEIASVQNVFDFGDGTTSKVLPGTIRLEEHEYTDFSISTKREYTVRMTMMDKRKCTKSVEQVVTVYPKLEARFALDKQEYCSPGQAIVSNQSVGGTQYAWSVDMPGGVLPDTYNRDPFTLNVSNPFPDRTVSYTVRLLATQSIDGFDCTSTYSQKFEVYPEVKPDFDPSVTIGCSPLKVQIDNNSSGLGEYHWFIDGVDRSKEVEPVFTLVNESKEDEREFEIRLRSTNSLQCSEEKSVKVVVYPHVEALFNLDAIEGCTPMILFGEAQSVSPVYSYQWDIPLGTPSTSTQVTTGRVEVLNNYSPARPLTVKVKLRTYLTYEPTCYDELEKEVVVHPAVRANFDGVFEGCDPYLFRPQNTTEVFNPSAATWHWSTTQGLTLSDREPELRLVNTSKEQDHLVRVSLRVTSDKGCEDEVVKEITIHPTPEANFRIDGTSEACTPFDVLLLNMSEGKDLKFTYDFGDGSSFFTTQRTPQLHRYQNLTQEEKSYQIKLNAESQFGCKTEALRDIIVYPAAHASFEVEPQSEGCSPLEVRLRNRSVGADHHRWDFGDGTTIEMLEPEHIFYNTTPTDATYSIKLSVASSRNCKDSITRDVKVLATPVARFDVDPPLLLYPEASVSFTNTTEPQPVGWVYKWDFGDGHFSHQKDPGKHEYTHWAPKEHGFAYKVKLAVDADHCRDEVEQLVYVYAPLPEGAFESEQTQGCAPMRIFFENNVEYADKFEWDFGDNSYSSDRDPIHVFEKPGTYNVKLTATGDGGVSSFYGIYVAHQAPEAQFTMHPDKVMLPRAIVKTQPTLTPHIQKFKWDFGDGNTSTLPAPVHEYKQAGDYVIRLYVESGEGCSDTVSSPVLTVLPPGKIKFPNAFRPSDLGPNGGVYEPYDRKNEVFHPYTDGIASYRLYIYNRWGELVYESRDVHLGWDGYRNGVLCKAGVYGWRVVGTFYNGEIFDQRGNVTLLR